MCVCEAGGIPMLQAPSSEWVVSHSAGPEGCTMALVRVLAAKGGRCPRCWHVRNVAWAICEGCGFREAR
jgi:hypothetical protein